MARIAIVVGHARTGAFCEALGQAYQRGALSAGHDAKLFVTSRMRFDPVLHEGFERVQPREPDLQAAHDAMMSADHLALIFPLWMGTLSAIFKGFLERVLQPELVALQKEKRFAPLLQGKSARVIVTMGMPGIVYRFWFGAHALKMLKGNILQFMGVTPVHSTVYGDVESVGQAGRERWLGEVEAMGAKAE